MSSSSTAELWIRLFLAETLVHNGFLAFFFFFAVLGFEPGSYTLSHSIIPPPLFFFFFFGDGFFLDRVSQTICLGWLQTTILLTSPT
jgi:hypothetical protein